MSEFSRVNSEINARLVHYGKDGSVTEEVIPRGVTHLSEERTYGEGTIRQIEKLVSDSASLRGAERIGFKGRLYEVTQILEDGTEGGSWHEGVPENANDNN